MDTATLQKEINITIKSMTKTSLQGRNRDTDVENKRMDTKGESRAGLGVVV